MTLDLIVVVKTVVLIQYSEDNVKLKELLVRAYLLHKKGINPSEYGLKTKRPGSGRKRVTLQRWPVFGASWLAQ